MLDGRRHLIWCENDPADQRLCGNPFSAAWTEWWLGFRSWLRLKPSRTVRYSFWESHLAD